MNTVNDLRQALSDDMRRLQPPGGLEARVLQHALQRSGDVVSVRRAERRNAFPSWEPKRRTELAAGIAAILLAAIIIGSFAYIRAATRPHTVAPLPCFTAPVCTPLSEPLSVGPSTPVILFYDPTSPARWSSPDMPVNYAKRDSYLVDGMTWDGQVTGAVARIPYPDPQQYSPTASPSNPAGTLFVAGPNILNRSGRIVAQLAVGPYEGLGEWGNNFNAGNNSLGAWADDELHYCRVGPFFPPNSPYSAGVTHLGPGTLQLMTPGGAPRDVAQVGETAIEMYVAACSVLADRAVVVQPGVSDGMGGPPSLTQYWVVQLSSGRVLWKRDTDSNLVASRDGRYVAETNSTIQATTTTIYGPNGSAVGHLTGMVTGFSWDGSLAVVVQSTPSANEVSVVRWLDGATIWTALLTTQEFAGSQSEPGGTRLAIETVDLHHPFMDHRTGVTFGFPTVLYVVSSDGRVLARGVGGILGSP